MARILFKGSWFTSVRSNSWNETDFENLVISKAGGSVPWMDSCQVHSRCGRG